MAAIAIVSKAEAGAAAGTLATLAGVGGAAIALAGAVTAMTVAIFEGLAAAAAATVVGSELAPFFAAAGAAIGAAGIAAVAGATAGMAAAIAAAGGAIAAAFATPLQHGGIVSSPTFAMLGEAGPEAVIPLSGSNAFGEQHMTIIIEEDGRERARTTLRYLPGLVRMKGVAV